MKMMKYIVMIILLAMTIAGCSSTEYISVTDDFFVRSDHRQDAPVVMNLGFAHHGKVEETYGEGENAWYKIGSNKWVSAKDCVIEPEKIKRIKNIYREIALLPGGFAVIKDKCKGKKGINLSSENVTVFKDTLVTVKEAVYNRDQDKLILKVKEYGDKDFIYDEEFYIDRDKCDFENKDKIKEIKKELDEQIKRVEKKRERNPFVLQKHFVRNEYGITNVYVVVHNQSKKERLAVVNLKLYSDRTGNFITRLQHSETLPSGETWECKFPIDYFAQEPVTYEIDIKETLF